METPKTVIHTQCKKLSAEKSINKTLLTPCRRVGLKRKSLSVLQKKGSESLESLSNNSSMTPNLPGSNRPMLLERNKVLKIRRLHLDNSIDVQPDTKMNDRGYKSNKKMIKEEMYGEKCDGNSSKENTNTGVVKCNPNTELNDIHIMALKGHHLIQEAPEVVTNELLLDIVRRIKLKESRFQSLDQSAMYAKKHDPNVLRQLIVKWRIGCQEALREMQSLLCEKGMNMSLANLLDQFRIPYDVLQFSEDCAEFNE